MEIIFDKPEYLWLLFSVPLLIFAHFAALKSVKRRALKFANFAAIQRVTGGELLSKNLFLLIVRIFILLLFIFSIAGVTLIYKGMASNYDYILAMDNSNSMIVEDFKPNRFVVAKETAREFVENLGPDNYVGVLSFSSVSQVETPLSNDQLHVKKVINDIQLSDVGGTDLGQAIVNGANLLLQSDKGKSIILLSDGQNNIGLPLEQAVDYANIREITIYTVGMATEEGADFFGVPLVLDEETLSYIAISTGGKYYKVSSEEELKKAYDEIANITERKISNNLSLTFIILALLLLLYEWILINTKYRTLP